MKRLYFDCSAGIIGDMLVGSLLGLFDDPNAVLAQIADKLPEKAILTCSRAINNGVEGMKFNAEISDCHHHHHHGRSVADVKNVINNTAVSDNAKINAMGIYDIVAAAESKVHEASVDTVHFHEVGETRAIYIIVIACELLEKLKSEYGIERVIISPINLGAGTVKCAHGILPVPPPAVKEISNGMDTYAASSEVGELATPTGIAFIKYFAKEYLLSSSITPLKESVGISGRDIPLAGGTKAVIC